MSRPLSPAAQAVLDAMRRSYDHEPTRRALAAGVLRAAADEVVPKDSLSSFMPGARVGRLFELQRRATRRQLLDIASELEGQSNG